MWEELYKKILDCFNIKKADPLCDSCKKKLVDQVIFIETKTGIIKYFCEDCIENKYLYEV